MKQKDIQLPCPNCGSTTWTETDYFKCNDCNETLRHISASEENLNKNKIIQVKDDPELLDLMLLDSKKSSSLYNPTNYWQRHNKLCVPELKSKGLKNLRRRKKSILSSFGATDLNPSTKFLNTLYGGIGSKKRRIAYFLIRNFLKSNIGKKIFKFITDGFSGIDEDDLNLLCCIFAKHYGETHNAKPISEFETTLIGNPENIFKMENKLYSIRILTYYVRYAYCNNFIDFSNINSIAEIGSGAGRQVEVIKKLYPHITFYLLDILPELYVAEQYLSALFPNSVVSYRETRNMNKIPYTKGKIYILDPSKIVALDSYDLFMNSSSFQEMEPNVVLNYLKYVNKQAKYVFLSNTLQGREVAKKPGKHGVIKKTTLSHYKSGLSNFEIKDTEPQIKFPRISRAKYHRFMFWERKIESN